MALGASLGNLDPRIRRQMQQGNIATPENGYAAAVPTQAGNYDEIMQGYRDQLGRGNTSASRTDSRYDDALNRFGQPTDISYQEDPRVSGAFTNLQELAATGGLNEQGQADLRARGVSPIRAVYGNMQRGMDRQRALSGGYSPNYNAAATRMARESSESIAGATQNVNADIARMVQDGRLRAAPELATLANNTNQLRNNMSVENARNRTAHMGNYTDLLNGASSSTNQRNSNNNEALRGMTSLYGTTPALVETFGNQVANRSAQNQNGVQQRQNYRQSGVRMMGGAR